MRTCTFAVVFCLGAVGLLVASCGGSEERNFTGGGNEDSGTTGGTGGSTASGGSGGSGGKGGTGGGTGGTAGSGGSTGGAGGSGGSGGTGAEAGAAGAAGAGPSEAVVYDFYAQACTGSWLQSPDSASGATPFQCNAALAGASARTLAAATLEGPEAAVNVLRITPPLSAEGIVSGEFVGINLIGTTAPVLKARIGCPAAAANCNFRWQVVVRPGGGTGAPVAFEQGFEASDGIVYDLNLDLAPVAGGTADIALVVTANGQSSLDDVALWVHPRIVDSP